MNRNELRRFGLELLCVALEGLAFVGAMQFVAYVSWTILKAIVYFVRLKA